MFYFTLVPSSSDGPYEGLQYFGSREICIFPLNYPVTQCCPEHGAVELVQETSESTMME